MIYYGANNNPIYYGANEATIYYGSELIYPTTITGLSISSAVTFSKGGSAQTIKVKSGTYWKILTDPAATWISGITPSTGVGGRFNVSVVCEENTTGSARTTTLTAMTTDSAYSATCIVTQSEKGLPNKPFSFNYNAKLFNATTSSIPKTEGQHYDGDMNIVNGVVRDYHTQGYIGLYSVNYALIHDDYLARTGSEPMTILWKVQNNSSSSGVNIFANRGSALGGDPMNYMIRPGGSINSFHVQQASTNGLYVSGLTSGPNICGLIADENGKIRLHSFTDNIDSNIEDTNYREGNSYASFFRGGYNHSWEYWNGDFYWMYMSPYALTAAEMQEVIDYNENLE